MIGEPVDVMSIGLRDRRRELVATCERGGRRYDVALLDVSIDADPGLARLLAGYRRWLGAPDSVD